MYTSFIYQKFSQNIAHYGYMLFPIVWRGSQVDTVIQNTFLFRTLYS